MSNSIKTLLLACLIIVLQSQNTLFAWNVKIIDSSGIDPSEMKTLVNTVTAGCETEQQKMEALWTFITGRPFYHWCEAREGREGSNEFGIVYDPIKAFNVYGTTICYQVADILANMAQESGITARTRSFPYKHKVMEAFYDGSWHLFDAQYDCQAIYYKKDGKTVASLNEVDSDPQYYLIDQPNKSEPFFQFEKWAGNCWPWETRQWVKENWFEYFETSELERYLPFDQQGHRMVVSLRRGEKLVRYWDNAGKWFCSPELKKIWSHDLTQKWVAMGPHDPRNPLNTYANGKLIYSPDWAAAEENFFDGLHEGSNYRLSSGKLLPENPEQKAEVVFRISSPYLLVGHPNRLDVEGDSRDGAIFRANLYRVNSTAKATISISRDEGVTWVEAWTDDQTGVHSVEVDLTSLVEGGYSYLLKLELEASGNGEVWLSDMILENSIFYSPVLLPRVITGKNEFHIKLSEPLTQFCFYPDFSSMEALKPYVHSIDNILYQKPFNDRLAPPVGETGSLVVEIAPGGNSMIHDLTIQGSFGFSPLAEEEDSITVYYSTESSSGWQPVYQISSKHSGQQWEAGFSEPGRQALAEHWRFDKSAEIKLPEPSRKCYVKFRIKRNVRASLNTFKVYAYCRKEREKEASLSDFEITHVWFEDGELRTHTQSPDSNNFSYSFQTADSLITNESITIEMKNKASP